ncbi:Uncharacterized protein TCM_002852 [Theobroma cacao]|uniref:Uncharacterized protein n=1 Tax=Theobroma cacao TaxID=3641 RepID=A0A061DV35_THECC|nr:Uncharacterized protein TCM_002852 [Theobroma cacao]
MSKVFLNKFLKRRKILFIRRICGLKHANSRTWLRVLYKMVLVMLLNPFLGFSVARYDRFMRIWWWLLLRRLKRFL